MNEPLSGSRELQAFGTVAWGYVKNIAVDYPKVTLVSTFVLGYFGLNRASLPFLGIAVLGAAAIGTNKTRFLKAVTYYLKDQSEFIFNREQKAKNREKFDNDKFKIMTPKEFANGVLELCKDKVYEYPRIALYTAVGTLTLAYFQTSLLLFGLGCVTSLSIFMQKGTLLAMAKLKAQNLAKNPARTPEWMRNGAQKIADWFTVFYYIGIVPSAGSASA